MSMYKHRKIVKRQQTEGVESKAPSTPPKTSSLAQPTTSVELSEPPSALQSIAFEEPPTLTETWEALYVPPLPGSPTLAEWQQELREIEWECDKDVWESCPYD